MLKGSALFAIFGCFLSIISHLWLAVYRILALTDNISSDFYPVARVLDLVSLSLSFICTMSFMVFFVVFFFRLMKK